MKRVLSLFFLGFFILNIADVPLELIQAHSAYHQCCCKSGICHCHHMGKDDCPMQKKNLSHKTAAPSKGPSFSPWNCDSTDQKSTSPDYSKEFDIAAAVNPIPYAPPHFFSPASVKMPLPRIYQTIDQPPRIF